MGDDVMNTIQNCKSWARLWLLLFIGLLGGSGYGLTAQAAGIVTNCTSFGSGSGTLQAALGGGGTVTFQCSGTLIVPQITISADTKIDATRQTVALSGNNVNRVFLVNKGVKLELIQLTIRNGKGYLNGGGINNFGTVSVTNTTLLGNSAGAGGGIYNDHGTVSVTNSTLSGNSASGSGIYNYYGTLTISNSTFLANLGSSVIQDGYGTLTVTNSTLSNNNSSSGVINSGRGIVIISNCALVGNTGIGIMTAGDTITITDSTLSGNSGNAIFNYSNLTITNSTLSGNGAASAAFGGGISNGSGATLNITNSTVSGNKASAAGGGIHNFQGKLTVTNSTVSDNRAGSDGGGIHGDYGSITLTNSTVSGNTATRSGGGITLEHSATMTLINSTVSSNNAPNIRGIYSSGYGVTLTNSIIANTITDNGTTGKNCNVGIRIFDRGYNIADDNTCNLTAVNSQPNTNPKLGPLANNGGPTKTNALLVGSPAINKGDCNGGTVLTDQRSVPRPQPVGGVCDIGAFELELLY